MRFSFERVREMVRKEFRQIFRDPRLWRLILVAPIIQLMVFGYAVSTDVRNTPTFVVDHDQSRLSRELIDTFTASGYFRLEGRSDREADLVSALNHGDVVMGMVIPPDFAKNVDSATGTSIQLLFDGSNSNIATVAKGYAERITQSWGLEHVAVQTTPPVSLQDRAWFNPELASRNYNVPAVVGAIIMLICLLLTALAIVRERETGTLEQLMVSPLQPAELIAGKTLPFGIIGIIDLFVVTTVALLWFHIPFKGNFLTLLLASILYLLSGLGIGLLISTVSKTQQEAFLTTFLVFMPTILLSGFMFPVSSMPPLFQWITLVNPMRHYLVIVRAIFLKGSPIIALWPQLVALTVLGFGILIFATTRFHKRGT